MAGRAPRVRRVRPAGRSLRFAIVAARFNERITERLVQGALKVFRGARLSGEAAEAALAMAEWIQQLRHDGGIVRRVKSTGAEPHVPPSGHPRLLRPRGTR